MNKEVYEDEKIDYTLYSLGELQEAIDEIEYEAPRDKRTMAYKEWRDDINLLFELFNKKAKFKTYNKIIK